MFLPPSHLIVRNAIILSPARACRFDRDPVDLYIEEFKLLKLIDTGEPVRAPTIAECLSHTGGFDCNDARGVWRFPSIYNGNIADVSREIAAKGLRFEPGTQHAYSRLGFDVTARVAKVVKQKSSRD